MPERALPREGAEQLAHLLRRAPDRAAGMDAWKPRQWRLLGPRAVEGLVLLFQAVEAGAPWPRSACMASTVCIEKPST
eukprot:6075936-Alexandrium_andersonii.AAC.1